MPRTRRAQTNIVESIDEIPVSANALTRSILEYLTLMGIKAWRNNSGALRPQRSDGTHGFIRFGLKGSGDVLGILPPTGRFLSIEVKVGKDRIRPSQQEWMDEVNALGGLAFVAHTIDDVIQTIEKTR